MTSTRPRGRPRSFDKEAALDAAMSVFWKHGYDGSSIADLTEAMGFTPPTLYAAFGSKEQLYRDVLAYYVQRTGTMRVQAMSADVSAYEAIRGYLQQAATNFTNPNRPSGCMISTASLNCAAENEPARVAAASMRADAFALLVHKLEQAKALGELSASTDTLALARFYTAIIQGMSVQAIDGASNADLQKVADLAMATWPGLRPT